nr:small VCP/p97-interacting protein-like isoform X3 [Oncorhynchus nerka]
MCRRQMIYRETRRRQLAETAEQRQKETTSRGVKNPQAAERNKKNKEMEKQEMRPSPPGGGGGLKVEMDMERSWKSQSRRRFS